MKENEFSSKLRFGGRKRYHYIGQENFQRGNEKIANLLKWFGRFEYTGGGLEYKTYTRGGSGGGGGSLSAQISSDYASVSDLLNMMNL